MPTRAKSRQQHYLKRVELLISRLEAYQKLNKEMVTVQQADKATPRGSQIESEGVSTLIVGDEKLQTLKSELARAEEQATLNEEYLKSKESQRQTWARWLLLTDCTESERYPASRRS